MDKGSFHAVQGTFRLPLLIYSIGPIQNTCYNLRLDVETGNSAPPGLCA